MFTKGTYVKDNVNYEVIMKHSKAYTEALLVIGGTVVSAYKADMSGEYSFNTSKAKEFAKLIKDGVKGCTSKNGSPMPFELGALSQHEFTKTKINYVMQMFKGEVVGAYIQTVDSRVEIQFCYEINFPDMQYVKLTSTNSSGFNLVDNEEDAIAIRSVSEISLDKEDITWLNNKKYYIVNDDETAEKLFEYFENYNGVIAYDTETTGLHINCFGKIGSSYMKTLDEYNRNNPKDMIRADKFVGLIFCVENDVSYYFPSFNRKFKNLYEDLNSPFRQKLITNTRARYNVGDLRDSYGDMRGYINSTPDAELDLGVLLMERCRDILEKKHLVAHNGTFEWKVGWQYEVDTNIKDDTMIMHQLMYKFRTTTSNRGEPSNLKYLARVELGIDQWELSDFFPDWKPDKKGLIREKAGDKGSSKKSQIDFSYMDYDGTRIYAPTDGDVTYQLFNKYKTDMMYNHKEMEYIYSVEMIASLAVAYMEFYGHRIDESKILGARNNTKANLVMIESEIRQAIGYCKDEEKVAYDRIKEHREEIKRLEKEDRSKLKEAEVYLSKLSDELSEAVAKNTEYVLNLSAPGQVAELFYTTLGYPMAGDKPSVAKKEVKALLKDSNEDGTPKYPIAHMYSKYKNEDTLMSKFFDNLPYFMYPGGIIFSSYGLISTATGRMSCSKPNAQQYPKVITKIVVPREGFVMVDADYSQIEYRVLTALAKNDWLAELFKDPDSDYHTLMASLMYGVPYSSVTADMRSAAKSFNFGIPYGMGFGSLAILLTGKNTPQTREEAMEKYEMYFANQPKTRKFFDDIKEMALVNGYTKTMFNRYRYYSFVDKDGNINHAKKAASLRQAGNAVIQGTAADIFKIGVARNFSYIRRNKLFGKLLITNMVHDEQLMEIDVQSLNMQRVLADVGKNMQFDIDGYPPLYIGAGVGKAWGYAKGKMAEIHPTLLAEITAEALSTPIFREDNSTKVDTSEVIHYFDNRVYNFRKEKVLKYVINEDNWGQDIHPAIGGLINLQFNYGRGDEAKKYIGPNGEKYTDAEFLLLNLEDFIKENNISVDINNFNTLNVVAEEEKEDEYDDGEENEEDMIVLEEYDEVGIFSQIDESSKLYGSSVRELIEIFGTCVLPKKKICGVNTKNMHFRRRDAILNYLMNFICDKEEDGALELVFLPDTNVLSYTGHFVKGIKASEFETRYKEFVTTVDSGVLDTSGNDVERRSNAK